jgi:glycosyltransferase involved in cell wall biosynthesis
VLELGCSTGDLLNALNVSEGVGVDISPVCIGIAQRRFPHLKWVGADAESLPDCTPLDKPFDVIILSDLVGYLGDIQETLKDLHRLSHPRSRIIISLWNWMWQPILRLGETIKLKAPDLQIRQNWLSVASIKNLLELADYETLQVLPGLLLPYQVPYLSKIVNSLSHAPLLQPFTLLHTMIVRPVPQAALQQASVSVVIPTRNEVANVAELVRRVPEMGAHTELLFVDGNSTDGTVEKIQEVIAAHSNRDIKFLPQLASNAANDDTPPNLMLKMGKGDAVRKGFAAASGDVLMILDSDLSVPPEELTKFYEAVVKGKAELVNGTRFNYQQEPGAMRPLNLIGNIFFSALFSWLLGQRITDTLCGTKALYRKNYELIAANRAYFGDFDPFGDFDLLFGAAGLKYRILDLPIHYRARTYGDSKVRVGKHGWLLARMSVIALWQLKLRPILTGKRIGEASAVTSELPFQPVRLLIFYMGRVRRVYWAWLAIAIILYFVSRTHPHQDR